MEREQKKQLYKAGDSLSGKTPFEEGPQPPPNTPRPLAGQTGAAKAVPAQEAGESPAAPREHRAISPQGRLRFERPQKAHVIRIDLPHPLTPNTRISPPAKAAHKNTADPAAQPHRAGQAEAHGTQKASATGKGGPLPTGGAAQNVGALPPATAPSGKASAQRVPLRPRPISLERSAHHRRIPQKKRSLPRRVVGGVLRGFGVFGLILGMAAVLVFGVITMICKGPFPTAKELFVVSVNETSAVKFLSRIYFTKEEVEEILAKNAVVVPDEVTDITQPFVAAAKEELDSIEVIDVYGSTYKGKMMIVHDPSRIRLATIPTFGNELRGKRVEQFVADEGAIAGINAGGFADEGGVGKGGMPLGLVIKDGQITSGSAKTECNLIGFDQNNRLVVGTMTGQSALDLGVRDAVHFEPTLIVNGKPAEVGGTGGGLNPRTVIGQREDGAVLLLVIDGRQPHSVGATLQDCMQEMLNFGAINAANLDGGSSSMMVYEGEVINVCASLNGSRSQPAAWLVM